MNDPFLEALGDRAGELPPAVLAFHDLSQGDVYLGRCDIVRGRGPLVALLLKIAGYPAAGQDVPIAVRLIPTPIEVDCERDFDGVKMTTKQGFVAKNQLVHEILGPVRLKIKPEVENGQIILTLEGMSFLKIPVPRLFWPRLQTLEFEENGIYHFDIAASAPVLGLLIRYSGWLKP